jgi:hypothetical protein
VFEKEYYGYIADTELVEAMNRLLTVCNAPKPIESNAFSQATTQIVKPSCNFNSNHIDQCEEFDSDEYY